MFTCDVCIIRFILPYFQEFVFYQRWFAVSFNAESNSVIGQIDRCIYPDKWMDLRSTVWSCEYTNFRYLSSYRRCESVDRIIWLCNENKSNETMFYYVYKNGIARCAIDVPYLLQRDGKERTSASLSGNKFVTRISFTLKLSCFIDWREKWLDVSDIPRAGLAKNKIKPSVRLTNCGKWGFVLLFYQWRYRESQHRS